MSPDTWPDLLVLVGDQIYADDTSPGAEERIRTLRKANGDDLPPELVANFEEFTWLYREAWTPEVERWMFSVVPSTMVFDDHDMIDDWNISAAWVQDIRSEPWWQEHIIGGLVSYWIYQHLGNLSPDEIDAEGLLARVQQADDAGDVLRAWAFASDECTPLPGGYRFSCYRELGAVRLVVIEARNARTLDRGERAMVGDDEWAWVVELCRRPVRHLVIATSLPVFVPGWSPRPAAVERGGVRRRMGTSVRVARRAAPAGIGPGGLARVRSVVPGLRRSPRGGGRARA